MYQDLGKQFYYHYDILLFRMIFSKARNIHVLNPTFRNLFIPMRNVHSKQELKIWIS